jgi:hypothetical protein
MNLRRDPFFDTSRSCCLLRANFPNLPAPDFPRDVRWIFTECLQTVIHFPVKFSGYPITVRRTMDDQILRPGPNPGLPGIATGPKRVLPILSLPIPSRSILCKIAQKTPNI